MSLRDTLGKIYTTYELLGGTKTHNDERLRAINAAMFGADPALQMSPEAAQVFEGTPKRRTAKNLTNTGTRLHQRAHRITGALKSDTQAASWAPHVCRLLLEAAAHYDHIRSSPSERLTLGRSITEMVLVFLARVEIHHDAAWEGLRASSQAIHVADTQSTEYKKATTNVVSLKDYSDRKNEET